MAGSGVITRKEIITDEALKWGEDYAKELNLAIAKNKEFLESIKEYSNILTAIKGVQNNADYQKIKQQEIRAIQQANNVWKEQIQLENSLVSTMRRRELATESTNRKLQQERALLNETNKEIRLQSREQAGLVGAYEKLNRRRTEAQRTLANLLAAERQNPALIAKARKEFELLDARVKQVDATTKNYTKNIGNYQSAFNGFGASVRGVFSAFGLATGVAFAVQTLRDVFTTIRDVDQQLIAVRKTTNMTNEEIANFRKEIIDLADATDGISIDGLLKTSEIAGQLGIKGSQNILRFSKTIEQLKLTSDLVSDESVSAFAQFIQISSDSIENADRLGSVITELGNNFNATESKVLSNASEIQRGIAVYNTAAQNVLALGSATASLGSEAEVSRTAMQKTLGIFNKAISTGEGLERILKITGMTQAELSEQFNKDATVVFQKFIKGLSNIRKEGGNLKNTLDEVGLTEIRSFGVVGNLAANYEVLEEAMSRANAEYENNKALTDEAAQSAESIASIVEDLRKKWEVYILRQSDASDGTNKLRMFLMYLRDNLSTVIDRVVKIGTVFLTFIGVMKTVNGLMTLFSAFSAASAAAQLRFAMATGIGTKNTLAQVAALRAATTAQQGLNTAMTATPWGIVLAAISAVIIAYQVFNDEASRARRELEDFEDAQKDANKESANMSDENLSRILSNITKEYEVKKAQQGESIKLTEEESAAKTKAVQGFIDGTRMEIMANTELITSLENRRATFSNLSKIERESIQKSLISLRVRNESLVEQEKKYQSQLGDIQQQRNVNSANNDRELSEKEKREAERRRKEYLAGLKKLADEEFALYQFRIKNAIDLNKQIQDAENTDVNDRLNAFSENAQLESDLLRQTAEKKLKDISWYNDEVRTLKQEEINILLNGGSIERELNNQEILALEEYQAAVLSNQRKFNDARQKLIDDEVKRSDDRTKRILLNQDTELNNAITSANQVYQANLKIAKSESERLQISTEYESEIYRIKTEFAKKALDEQINAANALLQHEELSVEEREKLLNRLSELKRNLYDLDIKDGQEWSEKFLSIQQENFDKIKDMATEFAIAMADLTNVIFDRRISRIEEEQERWKEFYDAQIELAGDNERQKEYLQLEAEKKEKELEERKRKERMKQEIFNRTLATAQIGIDLARNLSQIKLSIAAGVAAAMAASPITLGQPWAGLIAAQGGVLSALAIGTAAAQTAAVLAAPMPKYEKGTDNHTGGFAEVAEKRPEVIIEPGKAPYIVSKRSILDLPKKTKVIPSVLDYEKLQRAAIMASLDSQMYRLSAYQTNQSFSDRYGSELLAEMKKNTEAVKKNKSNVVVYPQKVDIPYDIWKFNNHKWN